MKKYSVYIAVLLVLFAVSCSKSSNYNGVYVFDVNGFKAAYEAETAHANMDPDAKALSDQVINTLLADFKDFQIEVKDKEATATFKDEITKAKIEVLSQTKDETKLRMTPVDEAQKEQVATLTITGNKMTLDDGKPDSGKLYFMKK